MSPPLRGACSTAEARLWAAQDAGGAFGLSILFVGRFPDRERPGLLLGLTKNVFVSGYFWGFFVFVFYFSIFFLFWEVLKRVLEEITVLEVPWATFLQFLDCFMCGAVRVLFDNERQWKSAKGKCGRCWENGFIKPIKRYVQWIFPGLSSRKCLSKKDGSNERKKHEGKTPKRKKGRKCVAKLHKPMHPKLVWTWDKTFETSFFK